MKANRYTVVALMVLISAGCGGGERKGKAEPASAGPGQNLAPAVVSVRVMPDAPAGGDLLRAIAEAKDPNGDEITLSFSWYLNDQPTPVAEGDSLGPQFFRKGDRVVVEAVASDKKGRGKPLLSAPVIIGNIPPEVISVRLTPALVYPGDRIAAEAEGRDADGDDLTYIYEWRRNGELLEGETDAFLDTKGLKKKELVSVTVTPFDGTVRGKPRRSPPLIIANRPPEIISIPPAEISNGRYIYEVKAADADGDPLTFLLRNFPGGMTIDPAVGRIEWDILPGSYGSFHVDVVVSDGDAKAFQGFELSIRQEKD